jgi:hypothetical protein
MDSCVCHVVVFGVVGVSSVGVVIVVIGNRVRKRVQKQKKMTSEGRKKFCFVANKVVYFYEGYILVGVSGSPALCRD